MSRRVRKTKQGIRLTLHELEAEIMDVIWSKKLKHFSVEDVRQHLSKKKPRAYTTVMTTVARLFEKSLLIRCKDGRRYAYDVKMSREEYLEATARDVLTRSVSNQSALALLAEKVPQASSAELDALEDLIRSRREELEE